MKRSFILLGLMLLLANLGISQKIFFIYMQTEGGQQFSVKVDNKVHHSTSKGYVILPRLKDSTYTINVIFHGDEVLEQRYTIAIRGKDHGYLLKNFGEKGWGLYDLHTSALQMSQPDPARAGIRVEPRKVSRFTQILALAARDPSLLVTEIMPQHAVVREEVKPEVAKLPPTETETPKTLTAEPPVTEKTQPRLEPQEAVKDDKPVIGAASIAKVGGVAERNEPVTREKPVPKEEKIEGKKEEKLEKPIEQPIATVPAKDTLTKLEKTPVIEAKEEIAKREPVPVNREPGEVEKGKVEVKRPAGNQEPNPGQEAGLEPKKEGEEKKNPQKTAKPKKEPSAVTYKPSVVTRRSESSTTEGFGLTFTDQYADGKTDTIRIIIPNPKYNLAPRQSEPKDDKKFLNITSEKKPDEPVAEPAVRKNKCKETASESDFLRLRKRMTAEKSDDGRVDEARKAFRSNCYTVEQVRNLASLFQDDGGRYRFFDECYLHVMDLENFPTLEKEIRDEYYLGRFRAMVK